MRLLLVSHVPLLAELGAAQVTLNLAEALRRRGHTVEAWSPGPLDGARWWELWRCQRRAIEEHLERAGPFDVVDLPAVSISRRIAASARTVARSLQPDLRYRWSTLRSEALRWPPSPRFPFHVAYDLTFAGATIGGWHRADRVLALGVLEERWLRRRFPWLAAKIRTYGCAPSGLRRQELSAVRRGRTPPAGAGLRFLWIGRWTAHKGTRRLVRYIARRSKTYPDDRFTIAGTGDEAANGLPAELLEDGTVRWVPRFDRTRLADLLAEHDVGLFTSRVEGWGLTLNEMIESGMPVYATPAGAAVDLADWTRRCLFPFPPPDTLSSRTLPAGGDLTAYLQRFTWAGIAERYEADVLDGPGPERPGPPERLDAAGQSERSGRSRRGEAS